MSIKPRQVRTISPGEALALLGDVTVGRIVFTENAMPAVRPASHVVDAGEIIIRSHDGSAVLEGAATGTVIAYQADSVDVGERLGWSVVITGAATAIEDPGEIARHASSLFPWTSADGQLIRLRPGIVNGYRLEP